MEEKLQAKTLTPAAQAIEYLLNLARTREKSDEMIEKEPTNTAEDESKMEK